MQFPESKLKDSIVKKLIILFVLLGQLAVAQTKQMCLEDAIIGRYTYLRPQTTKGLAWRDAGSYTKTEGDSLLGIDAKSGKEKVVLTLTELKKITGKSFQAFPRYSWLSAQEIELKGQTDFFVVDITQKQLKYHIELPPEAQNQEFSKEGRFAAYTQGDNLFVTDTDRKTTQITTDGGNGIVNGKSVHRNEFGISGGIFISPKGNYLAFYRKDETMVKDYPLVDFMAREAEYTPVRYPMAGMASHHVTLGVYNLKTRKTIFLKTSKPLDHYLTNVAWSPDEKNIYMAELNREQNHMQMNCYSVESGEKEKTLFEEKSTTYVEPLTPIRFSKVNPNEFYYRTRENGWFHIYKYNTDGKLIQQITKGHREINKVLGFDEKEKNIFVEGTLDDPLQSHIYKVEVKTGKITKLTSPEGIHYGMLSPGATYLIDRWTAPKVPAKIDLYATKGKLIRNLSTAEDPLKDYNLGENKIVKLKTNDGKYDLYGRLILPPDFDASKKYPVIVYVYGGPHSQLVRKSWKNQARWWQYYMASKGYIAFTLDNRGTLNRGRAFETAVHRHLGVLETKDQMQGIAYLESLPYVDAKRIGVHGWSYGGFMTLNLMLRHPEVFKVGVAGGPVVDWSMYEIMYGERYMDMPQENPEGYKDSNMLNHIDKLQGKLMLIHGVQDKTVVMQHSMKFLRECVKQNKAVDFFAYPTHPHNVRGKDRLHLMEKVSLYFIENL